MERIQTHCKALDALANGGLPTGTITQLFGRRRWERASSPCSRHSPWLRPEGARLSWTLSSHTGTTSSPTGNHALSKRFGEGNTRGRRDDFEGDEAAEEEADNSNPAYDSTALN